MLVQGQKYVQAAELLHKAQKFKPRDNVQKYLEKVEQLARAGHSWAEGVLLRSWGPFPKAHARSVDLAGEFWGRHSR